MKTAGNKPAEQKGQPVLPLSTINMYLIAAGGRGSVVNIIYILILLCLGVRESPAHSNNLSLINNSHARGSADTLRVATWNLNRLSAGDTQRTEGIAEKIFKERADLVSLQEITDETALKQLLQRLEHTSYKGFIAHYIPYDLRLAYLYNANRIDSLSAYPLSNATGGDSWVQRRPFIFSFSLKDHPESPFQITAVNIHAKADIPNRSTAYQQRMESAEQLYLYVSNNHPNDRLLIMGDFNDDVDQSVFQNRLSPYYLFRGDQLQFRIATLNLTQNDSATTLDHREPIDHIILSDELTPFHKSGTSHLRSPLRYRSRSSAIDTLSDHYMVMTHLYFEHTTSSGKWGDQSEPKGKFSLSSAPNPLKHRTRISFKLTQSQKVSLTVYNLMGQTIKPLIRDEMLGTGLHTVVWQPTPTLPAGIYSYRLQVGDGTGITRRLTLLR